MADPFDVTAPADRLITPDVVLDQTRVHQQAAQDPTTGLYYFTQIIANGVRLEDEAAAPPTGTRDREGHLAISQVTPEGVLQARMYCRGFGHGASLAVENQGGTPYVWIEGRAVESAGGNGYGTRIVRLPFVANNITDYADTLDVYNPFPTGTEVAASIDFVAGRVAVARRDGGGNRYSIFDLTDFRQKNFGQPLATFLAANLEHRQAFTYFDDHVYEWYGTAYDATNTPPGNVHMTVINARNGALLTNHHRVTEADLQYREPEGLFVASLAGGRRLVYGWATGATGARRAALYALPLRDIPPDPGRYQSWAELVADDRLNYEHDPDQPDGPDNPVRVPMNETPRDYTFAIQEEPDADPDVAFIAVQDGRLDATSSLSVQYLGAGAYQFYAYQPHVAQIPYDPGSGLPEPPERSDEELRIAYTNFDEPQCVAIVAASEVTVSFGRIDGGGANTVISGRDRERAVAIRDALRAAGFNAETAAPGSGTGDPAAHIVNRNQPRAGVHLDLTDGQRAQFMAGGNVSWENVSQVGMAGTTAAFLEYHNAIARALGAGGDIPDLPDLPTLPPVGDTSNVWELGCNARYAAEVRETRSGILLIPASDLENVLTSVSFDRRLNEVSQAKVTLKYRSDLADCCEVLQWAEPAMFDLVIYRDDDVVWEGPIVTTDSSAEEIVIEARDMGWWVSRIVNSSQVFRSAQAGKTYAQIAYDMIMWCTQSSSYTDTPDWCRIKGYVYPWPTRLRMTRGKRGVQSKYMIEILDDLTAYGIEWTCVGRGLHLREQKDDKARALATLGNEDLSGAIHVIRSAEEGATRVFVTNQSDNSTTQDPAVTVTVGRSRPNPYGRLDWLINYDPQVEAEAEGEADKVDDQISADRTACKKRCTDAASREKTSIRNSDRTQKQKDAAYDAVDKRKDACADACDKAYDKAKKDRQAYVKSRTNQLKAQEMLEVARVQLRNRYPMPVTIKVNDGAALSPNAPLQFSWLVPGERFDVIADFQCRPISQAMRLTNVSVDWGTSGESVGVSFAPAAYEEEDPT